MSDAEFTTFDIVKLFNIKRERLREWMNSGFIKPSQAADGPGTKAKFSIVDILKLAVFIKFIDAGMNRRKASIFINANPSLNDRKDIESLQYIILLQGDKKNEWISYFEPGPWDIDKDLSLNGWNTGLILNFKKIKDEIQKEIK